MQLSERVTAWAKTTHKPLTILYRDLPTSIVGWWGPLNRTKKCG